MDNKFVDAIQRALDAGEESPAAACASCEPRRR
jgi:hypothetical protein